MKINWGTAIVLSIISFMTFIIVLVVTMTNNKNFNHDLVTEEYYKQELSFQDQLDRKKNAQNLVTNIQTEVTDDGFRISFPREMEYSVIKGNLRLYRPSNKAQDFTIPVALIAHQMIIPGKYLEKGRWNIEIDWSYEEENYYYKKEFTY